MACPLRLEYAGAVRHLTSRGNERRAIFRDDEDKEQFLGVLGRAVAMFRWKLHAYVLMGNHYHLLVETLEPNLFRGKRLSLETFRKGNGCLGGRRSTRSFPWWEGSSERKWKSSGCHEAALRGRRWRAFRGVKGPGRSRRSARSSGSDPGPRPTWQRPRPGGLKRTRNFERRSKARWTYSGSKPHKSRPDPYSFDP